MHLLLPPLLAAALAVDAAAPPAPRRIVSLLPAATEILVELGGAGRVVGRTTLDRHPAVAAATPVGDGVRPVVEVVLSLRPDLVVTWAGVTDRRIVALLERFQVPVYPARMESLDDVVRTARELGALLGLGGDGERLARRVSAGIERVAGSAPPLAERPRVLLLLDPVTRLTAGPGTFLDEIVGVAGGVNVFGGAAVPWPVVGPESVLAEDPDLVVVAERPGVTGEAAGPLWNALRAVREGRVLRLPAARLTRPGAGVVELADTLADFFRRTGRR